ncbi:hypothetical protein [Hyphobacterium sp.]|uniref:hypothetical protein n=1 Tax=Hyphobacterium sp. TaxID=2004662 RepID=UPI003747E581
MTYLAASQPRFILHIGANKTGTSSIQRMLLENRQVLHDAGWEYPDFHLLHMAHHRLAYSIGGRRDLALAGDWESEFRNLISDRDKRFVFSSELFFRVVPPEKVAHFFPPEETRIVLYLRDHLSYMMSWYAQAVQGRNLIADFSDYVKVFNTPLTSYLSRWEEVYGHDRIVLRPFVRSMLEGQDSRIDFLQFVDGVAPSAATLAAAESNLSISGNLLFFKRLLNNYMTIEEAESYPITEEFGGLSMAKESFNGRFKASRDEVGTVRRVFHADIAALAQRGLEFPPMPEEVTGHACPNFDTLHEDVRLIKEIAMNTGKHFLRYATRWQDWRSL